MSSSTEEPAGLGDLSTMFTDAGEWPFDPRDWEKVDGLWSDYVESGRTRDRIIRTEAPWGAPIEVLASQIQLIVRSTRAQRAALRAHDAAFAAERKADREALGVFDDGG